MLLFASCKKENLVVSSSTPTVSTETAKGHESTSNKDKSFVNTLIDDNIPASLNPARAKIPDFDQHPDANGCSPGRSQCLDVSVGALTAHQLIDAIDDGNLRNVLTPALISVLSGGDVVIQKLLIGVQLGQKNMVYVTNQSAFGTRTTYVIGVTNNMPQTPYEGAIVVNY